MRGGRLHAFFRPGKCRDNGGRGNESICAVKRTTGWLPTCFAMPGIRALVLDPFGGTGTTAEAAIGMGRRAVICELNAEYVDLARQRSVAPRRRRRNSSGSHAIGGTEKK